MSRRSIGLDDAVHHYLLDVSPREPDVLRRLREETAARENADMQIAPEQGQFMALLVRLIGAERTLEVGTFTGYSALVVALALPPHGRVTACEISEEYAAVARRWWAEGGAQEKIEIRVAPAAETLDRMLEEGLAGRFDFAFIDADKAGYVEYWERCLRLVRKGGLIAVDNVLWDGRVADPTNDEESTNAIRAFNAHARDDDRVDLALVPIGDGLTLARVR
ncbi:MAG TPA: class I SAM-dependent methyltransferase [Gemmatimonadota bacterium]|nr:class I SAM-dependent methyltransferase [Gemmatimonadota bacterium]